MPDIESIMATLTTLKRQQGTLKAKLTRLEAYHTPMTLVSAEQLKNACSVIELKQKLDGVKTIQREVNELREKYYSIATDE